MYVRWKALRFSFSYHQVSIPATKELIKAHQQGIAYIAEVKQSQLPQRGNSLASNLLAHVELDHAHGARPEHGVFRRRTLGGSACPDAFVAHCGDIVLALELLFGTWCPGS